MEATRLQKNTQPQLSLRFYNGMDPENPARRYCLCRNPKSAERETGTRLIRLSKLRGRSRTV